MASVESISFLSLVWCEVSVCALSPSVFVMHFPSNQCVLIFGISKETHWVSITLSIEQDRELQ